MGRLSSHIKLGIAALAGMLVLFSTCRPKKQEIPPIINAHLEIRDDSSHVVDSAIAYLYNNEAAFNQAIQNTQTGTYNSDGAFQVGTIINGKLIFEKIPSNQEYWLIVHDQSSFFPGTNIRIHKDNTEAYYYISAFQNGTEVFANVILKPMNALITFTGPGTTVSFDTADVSNRYQGGAFNPNSYIEVRKGEVAYMLRSSTCVWTGGTNVEGGKIAVENLVTCTSTPYTFRAEAGNFTNSTDQIEIYIGQNTSTPVLVLKDANPQTIVLATPPGAAYTFFAKFANNNPSPKKCVWESTVVATNVLGACR